MQDFQMKSCMSPLPARVIWLLLGMGTQEAHKPLEKLAGGAPAERQTKEA